MKPIRTKPIPGSNTNAARAERYLEVVGKGVANTTLATTAALLVKAFFASTRSEAIVIAGTAFTVLVSGLYAGYKVFTHRVRRRGRSHPNHPNH